jgi:hypothetical protein
MLDTPKMRYLLEVLKDVRAELDVPEVAELTSLALDRKVDKAITILEVVLAYEEV